MAFTTAENRGISIPFGEKSQADIKPKPLRLTQSQVNNFMFVSPEDLSPNHPVNTPVGTWQMHSDGHEVFFYPVSDERLREITIPDFRERRRKFMDKAKALVIRIGRFD